jgi:hypothetical protein
MQQPCSECGSRKHERSARTEGMPARVALTSPGDSHADLDSMMKRITASLPIKTPSTPNPMTPKKSRVQARAGRQIVEHRARLCCEICGMGVMYIGVIHHIKPVEDGGSGMCGNLIHLCPNCHAVVHVIRRYKKIGTHLSEWLNEHYSEEQCQLIIAVARETAHHREGKWTITE